MNRPLEVATFAAFLCVLPRAAGAQEPVLPAALATCNVRLLSWEADFLLLHKNAPARLRAGMLEGFQDRILSCDAKDAGARDRIYASYSRVWEALGTGDSVPAELLERTLHKHRAVRKRMRRTTPGDVVAEFRESLSRQENGSLDYDALADLLAQLETDDGKDLDDLALEDRESVYGWLQRWVATWPDRFTGQDGSPPPGGVSTQWIALLEKYTATIGHAAGKEGLARNLREVARALVEKCIAADRSSARYLEHLNPFLEVVSSAGSLVTPQDLEAATDGLFWVEREPPASSFVWKLTEVGPAAGALRQVRSARLARVSCVEPYTKVIEVGPGGGRFYLPEGHSAVLVYELVVITAAREDEPARREARVYVNQGLKRLLASRAQVEVLLPRQWLDGRLYLLCEDGPGVGAYFVEARCWSECRVIDRLRVYLEGQKGARSDRKESARRNAVRFAEELTPALKDGQFQDVLEELEHRAADCDAARPFASNQPYDPAWVRTALIGGGSANLPPSGIAEYLAEHGAHIGFDMAALEALRDQGWNPRPTGRSPSGVSTLIRLERAEP